MAQLLFQVKHSVGTLRLFICITFVLNGHFDCWMILLNMMNKLQIGNLLALGNDLLNIPILVMLKCFLFNCLLNVLIVNFLDWQLDFWRFIRRHFSHFLRRVRIFISTLFLLITDEFRIVHAFVCV